MLYPNRPSATKARSEFRKRGTAIALSLLLSCSLIQQSAALVSPTTKPRANVDVMQIADILGVRAEVERLSQLQPNNDSTQNDETVALRSKVIQKILIGYLQVRSAADKNDRELSYSFNLMRREQRKQDLINELFTLANFAQLGTLYTMEPFLRLNKQFQPSGICTQTGSGVGLILPIVSILQQKTAVATHTTPPPIMRKLINGGPVDASDLPAYVEAYFSTPEAASTQTRKQEMFALWKSRFGVDASNPDNLCSLIENGKPKKLGMLSTRILLLWSIRTYILDMDHSLLALMRQIEKAQKLDDPGFDAHLEKLGVPSSAADAARLLKIQGKVSQLVELNKQGGASGVTSFEKRRLETDILERILKGALEVRVASDEVDAEINYASDVVLAELLAKRGKALQRNYEANFIQAGIFGSIAGLEYLRHFSKVGNEMFIISGGIGTALSVRALLLMRGGHRAIESTPNALNDVFNSPSQDQYTFSPLIATYLNTPEPDSKKLSTRAQALVQYWKDEKTTTVKLIKKKTLVGLAGAPPTKYDTIELVTNRISLLHGLLAHIELLDSELLSLLRATESAEPTTRATNAADTGASNATAVSTTASAPAFEALKLLGMQSHLHELSIAKNQTTQAADSVIANRLLFIRKIFTAALDVRSTSDILDSEISYEYDILGRMTRSRDHAVAVTNNINFFQLNVLAIIIDGTLGLSGNPRHVRASNMLNIVSGLAVGGLALLTVVEQRGPGRPHPARPNMVGQCMGISPRNEFRFSPALWKFINEPPPGSADHLTRVQLMMASWKQTKSVSLNMDKESNREKVAAYGPSHSQHSETIKLLRNRLNMLFDVRGMVGLFDDDLDELLGLVG